MAIPIHPTKTGSVFIRNFDSGVFATLGAVPDPTNPIEPCYTLEVQQGTSTIKVPVFFSQPEPIFQKKVFPFVTVFREDIALAMHRWMGVGQLEYRAGVSGTQTVLNGVTGFGAYERKVQAMPHDITYTISVWDRYEGTTHQMLRKVLQQLHPIGRLIVYDDLSQRRSYEYYWEGSIVTLQEVIDPVTRARGYALTIRVEGELDLSDPYTLDSVSGVELNISRLKTVW